MKQQRRSTKRDPSANGASTPEAARAALGRKGFSQRFEVLVANLEKVIKGKQDPIRLALVALFAEGHVLFEDVPGVGKSMLARSIGRSISAQEGRVQCAPDMLPSDILGSSIFNQRDFSFTFRPGPIFANILLVDEINRATPKTQSALLEAMQERAVTVLGTTHELPKPFLVLATENPVEQAGTFPLPEAQLDRFLFRLSMGYPSAEAEEEILLANAEHAPIDDLTPVLGREDVLAMTSWAKGVTVSQEVLRYIIALVQATRDDTSFLLAASPRASLALMWSARVLAASQGREDVYPDDVKVLVNAVMGHRVALTPEAVLRGDSVTEVLTRLIERVKAPMVKSPV
jgi:MoxR-like ATPase